MFKIQWLAFLSLLFCASCLQGKKSFPRSIETKEEVTADDQGVFLASLRPLNTQFGDVTAGTVKVKIAGDLFEVAGDVFSSPANTKHIQLLTSSSRCPDTSDDTNLDGILDLKEALDASGKVLIPLDSDLSEQLLGVDFGPIANGSGRFVYRRSTSFSLLLSDLLTDDPDRTDIYVKLLQGELLDLSRRVVVILGFRDDTVLPPSYKNPASLAPQESVPIACGKFSRTPAEDQLW